jgi:hypothetical protein
MKNSPTNEAQVLPKAPSFLSRMATPDPSMNYNFIAIVYAVLSILSGMFYLLEHFNVLEAIHGFWIVPLPCLPCLFYVLFLRARVAKSTTVAADKKSQ